MNILLYMVILVCKMIEVSIATTRIVLITRGERILGACLGFIEVIIWVVLVSTVLKDVSDDPLKVVVYALGFALGNYMGSIVEEKLGIGTVRVEAIVTKEDGIDLVEDIRLQGYAVTVIEGKGMHNERLVLVMNIKRKRYNKLVRIIKEHGDNAVITINDIKPVYGGYGILKR